MFVTSLHFSYIIRLRSISPGAMWLTHISHLTWDTFMMGPFNRQAQGSLLREGMGQTHQQCCCAAAGSGLQVPHGVVWVMMVKGGGISWARLALKIIIWLLMAPVAPGTRRDCLGFALNWKRRIKVIKAESSRDWEVNKYCLKVIK